MVPRPVSDCAVFRLNQDLNPPVTDDLHLVRDAAKMKAKHGMSYAGCFAAALAKLRHAELVTGDPEFKEVEGEVKVVWLPEN